MTAEITCLLRRYRGKQVCEAKVLPAKDMQRVAMLSGEVLVDIFIHGLKHLKQKQQNYSNMKCLSMTYCHNSLILFVRLFVGQSLYTKI